MSVKTIVYTSNPDFVPNSLESIRTFANRNDKFYTCYVNDDDPLANVEPGAHIVTTKGNNVYVLNVYDGMAEIVGKKNSIVGVAELNYPFNKVRSTSKKTNNTLASYSDKLKNMFMPTEAEGVRVAMDGGICVATSQGYVTINDNNELVSYPEELTIDALPAYIISKPASKLVKGDIIALDRSYAKVTNVSENGRITAISYTGTGKSIHTIKDFLLNQSVVRVVVSLAGQVNGLGMNPMMMIALSMSNKKDLKSILPLMMMSQQNGAMGMNPMMLMAMGDDVNMKDIFMLSAMGGQNLFGNMFQAPTAAPAAAPAAPVVVKATAPVVDNANGDTEE